MQRLRVGLSMEIERCAGNSQRGIVRQNRESAIENRRCFGEPAQKLIAARELLQRVDIARVEFQGAGKVARRVVPFSLAAIDETGQLENQRLVRQGTPGDLQFLPRPPVIEETAVKMLGQGEVRFSRVGSQALGRFDRGLGQREPGRRVVGPNQINLIMDAGEPAIGQEVFWIPCDGLFEKVSCLEQVFRSLDVEKGQ